VFKELLVGFIHIEDGRIQGLAIGFSQPGEILFGIHQLVYQVIGTDGPLGFPKPSAQVQTGVIYPPAAAEGFMDQFLLLRGRVNPVFVSLEHPAKLGDYGSGYSIIFTQLE